MPKRKSITLPRKRKRPSDAPTEEASSPQAPSATVPQPGRKRRRSSPSRQTHHSPSPSNSPVQSASPAPSASSASSSSSSAAADELTSQPFALLHAKTRQIPERTVRRKWQPLPESTQERILGIVNELQRPVLAQQRGGHKQRTEAQSALVELVRQIARRLPRMPFPKESREWEFDGEGVGRGCRDLEHSVNSARHSIALLQAEIERQEERLQTDEDALKDLEKNAKDEAGERRKVLSKRKDVLSSLSDSIPTDGAEEINLVVDGESQDDLDAQLDASLEPVVKLLDSHLASLEGNAAQTRGVEAFVLNATAQIDALVRKRLGEEKAEDLRAFL